VSAVARDGIAVRPLVRLRSVSHGYNRPAHEESDRMSVESANMNAPTSLKGKLDARLKAFEWTWTTAVLFSFGILMFLFVGVGVIPSFWLYYANTNLLWNQPRHFHLIFVTWDATAVWMTLIRDAVAMGLSTGPIITLLVGASIMQNWRRKLRGQTDSRPTGGYR
jgi:hypothetical protein